jgi:hypothetical protein
MRPFNPAYRLLTKMQTVINLSMTKLLFYYKLLSLKICLQPFLYKVLY